MADKKPIISVRAMHTSTKPQSPCVMCWLSQSLGGSKLPIIPALLNPSQQLFVHDQDDRLNYSCEMYLMSDKTK